MEKGGKNRWWLFQSLCYIMYMLYPGIYPYALIHHDTFLKSVMANDTMCGEMISPVRVNVIEGMCSWTKEVFKWKYTGTESMVWMMESRIINWMRRWLFRGWCCGAAHTSERSSGDWTSKCFPSTDLIDPDLCEEGGDYENVLFRHRQQKHWKTYIGHRYGERSQDMREAAALGSIIQDRYQ